MERKLISKLEIDIHVPRSTSQKTPQNFYLGTYATIQIDIRPIDTAKFKP